MNGDISPTIVITVSVNWLNRPEWNFSQMNNQARIQRGELWGLNPQESLHKKFWVYLFAALLSMCSLKMLLLMSW